MKRPDWIEVLVICIIAIIGWLAWPYSPSRIPVWKIALGISALLLLQGLVRDVTILLRKRHSASIEPRKAAQCMCLESTAGIVGIIAAAVLAGLDKLTLIAISRLDFSLAVAGTMAVGFVIKDLVISWNPPGMRREKDHLNLIVRWKNK